MLAAPGGPRGVAQGGDGGLEGDVLQGDDLNAGGCCEVAQAMPGTVLDEEHARGRHRLPAGRIGARAEFAENRGCLTAIEVADLLNQEAPWPLARSVAQIAGHHRGPVLELKVGNAFPGATPDGADADTGESRREDVACEAGTEERVLEPQRQAVGLGLGRRRMRGPREEALDLGAEAAVAQEDAWRVRENGA